MEKRGPEGQRAGETEAERGGPRGRERGTQGRDRGSEPGRPDLGFQIVDSDDLASLTSCPGFTVVPQISFFSFFSGCQIKYRMPRYSWILEKQQLMFSVSMAPILHGMYLHLRKLLFF